MIGYCKKIKQVIITEADCYYCDKDLRNCKYFREKAPKLYDMKMYRYMKKIYKNKENK